MKQNTLQSNFTAGEISPQMVGRVDVNKYQNGAAQLTNFIVRPQGGISRRQGTSFLNSELNYLRCIPFVISANLSYVLEFGDEVIQVYTNGAVVAGVSITTPYQPSDLDLITYTQSADVMYLAHPNYPQQVLTRLSNTSWTLEPYVAEDGPYLDVDTSGNQAQIQLISDTCTLTSSTQSMALTAVATASSSLFTSGQATGYYILSTAQSGYTGAAYPIFVSTSYVSGTVLDGTLIPQSSTFIFGTGIFAIPTGTYSGGSLTVNTANFTAGCVGQYAYVKVSGTNTLFKITAFTNTTVVVATQLNVIVPGAVTIIISGSGAFVTADVGKYVEYLIQGVWYLGLIKSINAFNSVQIQPLANILLNSGEFDVAISGTTATSTYADVFSQNNIGMYVRATSPSSSAPGSGVWILITAWTNNASVTGTAVSMATYSYPSVTMTLQDDRITTCSINFSDPVFTVASDVGLQVRLQFASQWRSFTVTAISSPTQATGLLNDYVPYDLINASNIYNNGFADNFRLGAWSVENGYPAIVGFYEQRLIWANTSLQPNTVWFSQPADYYNMAPTEEDGTVISTDAINLTLSTGDANPITWMRSTQVLLLGTSGGEYEIVDPSGEGISPTNISCTGQSFYGSLTATQAYRFGVATLFLQRGGNKLREMLYQFQFNSFNSKDITIIAEHILRINGGAKSMAQQVDPISIFWIVCNDGTLVACTYDRDQDVVAFTECTIAGPTSGPNTGNGLVQNICVVPNADRDDVYMIVQRGTGLLAFYSLELMTPFFDTQAGDSLVDMCFLDWSANYSGSSTTTLTGLFWMAGNSPTVIGNGVNLGPIAVDSFGNMTLPVAVTTAVVGFPMKSIYGSLSPDGASTIGTSQGKRKKITEITARVKDALPFKHGPSLTNLTQIDAANFGTDLIPTANQGQLYTGDVRYSEDMAWDTQAQYFIVQDLPYPLTIESCMPILNANE